ADLAFAASAHHVARAILIGAEEGPATHHALGLRRFRWIERRLVTAWTRRDATRCERSVVVGPVPVADPLPDIARHVVEPVAVGWVGPHGRGTSVTILSRILAGE